MIEVAEIAEVYATLGKALQKIIFNGGVIALIFEDDDEHVVEMLWRRRRSRSGSGVPRKAENRNYQKKECYTSQSAVVPVPKRHVFSEPFAVLKVRRRPSLKGCTAQVPRKSRSYISYSDARVY